MATEPDEIVVVTRTKRQKTRGWNMKRRRNVAVFSDRCNDGSDSALIRGQRAIPIPIPPCHTVMKYMTPSLLALVALKYQGKTESVFGENLAPIWCFLVGSVIYWLIVEQMKRMETLNGRCFHVLNRVALASVILSVGSLASIFLHRRLTFVHLMVLMSLTVLLFVQPVLYRAYTWVRSGITIFNNRIRAKLAPPKTSLPV